MRIGIDARMMGALNGGIGRYVFELVKNVLKLDKKNEYILFCGSKNNEEELFKDFKQNLNVKFVVSNARHYSLAEQTSFLRLLNNTNCDLVHFPNFNVPLYYKKPFVVTIHDLVHHKISGAKKTRFLHFLAYKKVIKQAAKNARAIITVSEESKRDIVKYLNVLPRKVEVIYEGSSQNIDVAPEVAEKIKRRFYISKPYFLFVGVLERKKNIVNLTRGFDRFLEKYKYDMDLVVAGKADPHYPDIKFEALDIKNKNHLVFTGQLEEKELSGLYKGAYGFVSASLHEGFGLPGVEAMGFGLPLAVSNTKVFNEIYDNAAVYFDPLNVNDIAEKLDLLAKDPQFYQSLSQKSLERAELFSWEKTAQATLKVYSECLGEKL